MLDRARIPHDLLLQPSAGKFRAEPAELYAVPPRAFVNGTAAGFLPFRNDPVRFDAPGTLSFLEFRAPVAAFPAGCDPLKIDRFHDKNSCDIRFRNIVYHGSSVLSSQTK